MRSRRLDELAKRIEALEAVARGRGGLEGIEARLEAIEAALTDSLAGNRALAEVDVAAGRCAGLVAEHVPEESPLAVAGIVAGSQTALGPGPVIAFGGQSSAAEGKGGFEHGVAALASLEAARAQGARYLLLPAPTRDWLEHLPELADHLGRWYRVVADDPDAGTLYDLQARNGEAAGTLTLPEELDRLADGNPYAPVLAWTELELAATMPGRNVFALDVDQGELPYLDRTIEIVVVDDPERLGEARRVSAGAVVRVAARANGAIEVVEVEEVGGERGRAIDQALVIVAANGDAGWADRVREALGDATGREVIESPEPWAAAADADLAVVVEDGVLPLPGCLHALVGTLTNAEDAAVSTGKLLDASGALAASGVAVFADGTIAGIGAGEGAVAASWHEYVRPVWAAGGVLALRGSQARIIADHSASLLAASAALWRQGHRVVYQPDAGAVRVHDGAPDTYGIGEWTDALASCPDRPAALDAPAWHELLTRFDPAEAWR